MDDLFSGFVMVFALMLVVYAVDTLADRLGRFAQQIQLVCTVVGIAATVAGVAWLMSSGIDDESMALAAGGVAAGGLVLAGVALPHTRRLIERAFPGDGDDNGRFEIGLVILLWLVILRIVEYYGTDPTFAAVDLTAAAAQTLAFLGVALALVGFLTRRDTSRTIRRLGLHRLTSQGVWVAFLAVIGMYIVGAISIVAVDWISPGSSERLSETVEQITGGETGLGYALALGIFAATGEETLFRGALQPKYGLVFTALVFSLLHVQYDLLLIVASLFPVGLILGFQRKYFGTISCIITHMLYNTLAVLAGG